MYRFIETILIREGKACNLDAHQRRINRTFGRFFSTRPVELTTHLHNLPGAGTHRCRITYGKTVEKIEFFPYERVKKAKLLAVESDLIYNYKFASREGLDRLAGDAAKEQCDDALIVKNGLVTDTTIANIAFFDGKQWLTPIRPLLRGTARERLLARGVIHPGNIRVEELERFEKFALFNALSGFYVAGNINQIVR